MAKNVFEIVICPEYYNNFLKNVEENNLKKVKITLYLFPKLANTTYYENFGTKDHPYKHLYKDVSPLMLANSEEMINLLFNKGAEISKVICKEDKNVEPITALSYTLQLFEDGKKSEINLEKADWLAKLSTTELNGTFYREGYYTLLDLALKYRNEVALKFLIERGARALSDNSFYKGSIFEPMREVFLYILSVICNLRLDFRIEELKDSRKYLSMLYNDVWTLKSMFKVTLDIKAINEYVEKLRKEAKRKNKEKVIKEYGGKFVCDCDEQLLKEREEFKKLLAHFICATDSHGRTPLFYAESARMASLILDLGADPNAVDDNGNTALCYAKDANVAYELIRGGAKTLVQSDEFNQVNEEIRKYLLGEL